MGEHQIRTGLRELRLRAGLQQRELAERAEVSRQTLSALEQGESVPATDLALRLCRVLGCRVEDMFWLEDDGGSLEATLLAARAAGAGAGAGAVADGGALAGQRVAIAAMDAQVAVPRWLARPLEGEDSGVGTPADGIVEERVGAGSEPARARIRSLRGTERLRQNLFVAGCDPALGLLAGHLGERFPGARLHWLEAGSGAALDLLARSEVHLGGAHLYDEETGEHNVAAVRRRLGDRAAVLVNLAVWEQGLVLAPGNPRRIRKVADLARKGVRLVGREKGTGSEELLGRRAAEAGVPRRALQFVAVARSHLAVARAVAAGTADAGVATRLAASALGLAFVPLDEARFDLVVPRGAVAADPRIERLLDVLRSPRFRRDLGALAGYSTTHTGQLMAETPALP
jgi:putative molybdopterin biosynthesis protein